MNAYKMSIKKIANTYTSVNTRTATSAAREPVGTVTEAFSRIVRPAIRYVRSLICITMRRLPWSGRRAKWRMSGSTGFCTIYHM